MTTVTILRTRAHRYTVTLHLPAVGRKRALCTCSLASAGTVLFLASPAWLPGADVSALMVAASIGGPWGIGWAALLAMERRIVRDLLVDAQRGHDEAARR